MKKVKVGSDFSGVGAFNYALKRLNIDYEEVFACDMDKYARKAFVANHGEPLDFPDNVYNRNIPEDILDIYMTSPPCQSFSLAGKRQGKNDEKGRGILFFNSLEFIEKNKPRYFIFENVKGLLSDDSGRTFSEWVTLLGGKSINGNASFFPHPDSVPYHIYWKVLNAKDFNVPQNRERVFIVGIRDDEDDKFRFPKEEFLEKRLKDVLEDEVDEKYFLSEKMVSQLINNGVKTEHLNVDNKEFSNTLRVGGGQSLSEKHSFDMIKVVGNTNPSGNGMNGQVFDENGISPTLLTNKGEGIKIKSATSKGYEEATNEDSINFSNPHSKTRRGRVGKGVAQTLDTSCSQGVVVGDFRNDEGLRWRKDGNSPCLTSSMGGENYSPKGGTRNPPIICMPVQSPDRAEKKQNGRRFKDDGEEMFTLTTQDKHGVYDGYRIRRLTPTECFRLMDFPDSHVENCRKVGISDSQLYKQAGNSIVVKCLELLIKQFNLK
jgi:DNA (cytosine-5)-methyltransferase 1